MEFLKNNYKKILTILFCLLFMNFCTKSCIKSNEIRNLKNVIDSCSYNINNYNDSIIYLNNIINKKDIELEAKNEQIMQLNKTINTIINKNAINHIKVIVPEKNEQINE